LSATISPIIDVAMLLARNRLVSVLLAIWRRESTIIYILVWTVPSRITTSKKS